MELRHQNRMGGQRVSLLLHWVGHAGAGVGLVPLCPMITVEGPKQAQTERDLRADTSHYMQVTSYYRTRNEFLMEHT